MESCPMHPQMVSNIERLLQVAVRNETNIISTHETVQKLDIRINGTVDKMETHMKESEEYRKMVVRHTEQIGTLIEIKDDIKRFFWGNIIAILTAIVVATGAWITLNAKVDRVAHYSYGYQDNLNGTYPNYVK